MPYLIITADLSEGAELEGPTNIGDGELDAELVKDLEAIPNKKRGDWTEQDLYKHAYYTNYTPRMTLDLLEKHRYAVVNVLTTDTVIMWTLHQPRTSGFIKRKPAVKKPSGARTLPNPTTGMVRLSKGRKAAGVKGTATKKTNALQLESDKSEDDQENDPPVDKVEPPSGAKAKRRVSSAAK